MQEVTGKTGLVPETDFVKDLGLSSFDIMSETLICSHLAMILGMAKDTYRKYYGLSMEDYVGLGNVAMVTKFNRFKVGQKVPFAAYMKKIIERYILANVKKHVVWDRAEDVDIELVGILVFCWLVPCIECVNAMKRQQTRCYAMIFFLLVLFAFCHRS